MATLARWVLLLGVLASGWLPSAPVHAECGGTTQCIGVGPTEAAALLAHHGNGPDTFTLAFGNQPVGTSSASQTVVVAAVTGPAGTTAVLGPIAFTGANAPEFSVTGGSCASSGPVHGGSSCTITVAFNPASVGAKTATLHVPVDPPGCVGCITERVVSVTGSGTAPLPTATATTMTVQASTPTTLDLAGFISGTGTLSVRITAAPTHGVATVSGTRVTYTPAANYLGPDAFSYEVFNGVATSSPAVVTVTVVPRPDPSADANVVGLLRAQAQTARRFSRAQISNFQGRMESLHRGGGAAIAGAAGFASARGMNDANRQPARMPGESGPLREAGFLPASFASTLLSAATTRTLNLSGGSDRAGASSGPQGGTGLWIGGNLNFGSRDQTSDSSSLRFSTDGVSVGIDRRFSDRLALGIGLGYARDQTDIGSDGSMTRSKGSSVALYGSYQPGDNTFIDGLIGYGALNFDTNRFVAAANDFARGERKGEQWFGSLAAGYEHRSEGLLLSPYGRLDFARDRLKQYTETGAGLSALTYFEQRVPTLQFALGLRAESVHETAFGWALPRLRAEFRHDFKGEGQATLAYADLFSGPTYSVTPAVDKRNSLLLGIGSDFILRNGLKLGVDYQIQRMSGVDHNQAIRIWLARDLDGKGYTPGLLSVKTSAIPVRVEAGYTWDSNVNRARDAGDKLADRVYSLGVGSNTAVSLGETSRLLVAGFANGDKFGRYPGLDRLSGGGQGELQYRASGDFDAPIFGLFGRLSFDEHAGQLRSGHRYSIGVTVRQSLTDRIDVFGALAGNVRDAESAVFDTKDYSARFNLDYSLGRSGALYLAGEYRRGDAVSTIPQSAGFAAVSKVFVQDDAYGSNPLFAYRFEAKTVLWTLGYNLPLGPRDSLDFSGRRAQSTPTVQPTGIYAGAPRYTANQFSLAYLMRF